MIQTFKSFYASIIRILHNTAYLIV